MKARLPDNDGSPFERLIESWRGLAHQLRPYTPPAAEAFEAAAAALEHELVVLNDEILTLRAAAAASGYCVDHLRRLVREGTIPNAGRRHAPRIRRADLPRKPAPFDERTDGGYDPVADARQLAAVRNRGDKR